METKTCRQCGEIKPVEQFRKYYGGRKGTYSTCKFCEKINSREKYLSHKYDEGTISEEDALELYKIQRLWDFQKQLGLRPPRFSAGRSVPIAESLDSMIDRYGARAEAVANVPIQAGNAPPAELLKWLIEPLTKEPEYYQDDVYNTLRDQFRPQLSVDQKTMLPVYDDTFKDVLEQIAARFDEYEDGYYNKED